ncbi:MAG: hypothetical protein R2911_10705 [Caldilineaceae bacterium]
MSRNLSDSQKQAEKIAEIIERLGGSMSVMVRDKETNDNVSSEYIIGSSKNAHQNSLFSGERIDFVVPSRENSTALFESSFKPNVTRNIDSMPFDLKPKIPLVPMPALPVRKYFKEHFNVYQKWEGYVLEVTDDSFLARLVTLVGEGGDQKPRYISKKYQGRIVSWLSLELFLLEYWIS